MEKRVRRKYLKVRMEDELYAQLKQQAKLNNRPMTRQVETYISEGITRETRLDSPKAEKQASG